MRRCSGADALKRESKINVITPGWVTAPINDPVFDVALPLRSAPREAAMRIARGLERDRALIKTDARPLVVSALISRYFPHRSEEWAIAYFASHRRLNERHAAGAVDALVAQVSDSLCQLPAILRVAKGSFLGAQASSRLMSEYLGPLDRSPPFRARESMSLRSYKTPSRDDLAHSGPRQNWGQWQPRPATTDAASINGTGPSANQRASATMEPCGWPALAGRSPAPDPPSGSRLPACPRGDEVVLTGRRRHCGRCGISGHHGGRTEALFSKPSTACTFVMYNRAARLKGYTYWANYAAGTLGSTASTAQFRNQWLLRRYAYFLQRHLA